MKFIHQPNDKLIEIAKVNSEKKYMSVTKLTGKLSEDAINQWKANVGIEVADKVMKEASERGTCIHKFCEDYLTNEQILIPENSIDNYYTFKAMKPELNNINNVLVLGSKFKNRYPDATSAFPTYESDNPPDARRLRPAVNTTAFV